MRARTAAESADERFVDLFARGAHRKLLRVTTRRPLLAAQRPHRLAGDRGLEDLLLLHVVREALVISGFEVLFTNELFELSIEGHGAALIGATLIRVLEGGAHGQSVYREQRIA